MGLSPNTRSLTSPVSVQRLFPLKSVTWTLLIQNNDHTPRHEMLAGLQESNFGSEKI